MAKAPLTEEPASGFATDDTREVEAEGAEREADQGNRQEADEQLSERVDRLMND
jgi:hypothetical protein